MFKSSRIDHNVLTLHRYLFFQLILPSPPPLSLSAYKLELYQTIIHEIRYHPPLTLLFTLNCTGRSNSRMLTLLVGQRPGRNSKTRAHTFKDAHAFRSVNTFYVVHTGAPSRYLSLRAGINVARSRFSRSTPSLPSIYVSAAACTPIIYHVYTILRLLQPTWEGRRERENLERCLTS